MEPEEILPHTQEPSTCLYPEPDRSIPYSYIALPEDHLNIILPSTVGLPKWSLSFSGFALPKPVSVSSLPYTRHMTTHLIFLDFITFRYRTEYYFYLIFYGLLQLSG
jgi:hypothetical protein